MTLSVGRRSPNTSVVRSGFAGRTPQERYLHVGTYPELLRGKAS